MQTKEQKMGEAWERGYGGGNALFPSFLLTISASLTV